MDSSVYAFPTSREEALALLWLQQQDLSGKSPAQIHRLYWEALKEIRADYRQLRDEGYAFR